MTKCKKGNRGFAIHSPLLILMLKVPLTSDGVAAVAAVADVGGLLSGIDEVGATEEDAAGFEGVVDTVKEDDAGSDGDIFFSSNAAFSFNALNLR